MPNYKLTIQYEGTRYKGWQEQKHTEATIQGKLQRVLERMTEEYHSFLNSSFLPPSCNIPVKTNHISTSLPESGNDKS